MATRAATAATPSALDRLSTSGRVAFGAVFAVAFAAIYYIGFYSDVSAQVASAQSQEQALKSQLTAAQASKQAYQKDLEEKTRREANVREQKKALPDDAETPAFLGQLQTLASIAGVNLTSWSPQEEVVAEYYVRVPMKLTFTGRFHQILKFINLVGRAERITNVEDIKLKNPKVSGEEVTVEGECIATAFRSVKPGETPKKGAK